MNDGNHRYAPASGEREHERVEAVRTGTQQSVQGAIDDIGGSRLW
jgi:hypothetical protein